MLLEVGAGVLQRFRLQQNFTSNYTTFRFSVFVTPFFLLNVSVIERTGL